jgi:hypothetical protein
MQKLGLIAYTLITSTFSFGQHYYSADIIKKADNIMKATVGERLFTKYFHYDTDSYYEYKNFWGKKSWKTLTDTKRTRGKFKNMRVRYLFCLDTFNISCLLTWIQFDSILNKTDTVDTYFMPKYVLENKKCNFINDTTAINIAKTKFTRQGIKPISAGLSYDHNKKLYIWSVSNVLTKNVDSFGKDYGEIQIAEIDALTGEIINFYPEAIYGPIR